MFCSWGIDMNITNFYAIIHVIKCYNMKMGSSIIDEKICYNIELTKFLTPFELYVTRANKWYLIKIRRKLPLICFSLLTCLFECKTGRFVNDNICAVNCLSPVSLDRLFSPCAIVYCINRSVLIRSVVWFSGGESELLVLFF